jgi:autotransporter-associated beta strand protein
VGTVLLSGQNSFSGGVTVQSGTLSDSNTGFSGTVFLDSGVLTLANAQALGSATVVKAVGGTLEALVDTKLVATIDDAFHLPCVRYRTSPR